MRKWKKLSRAEYRRESSLCRKRHSTKIIPDSSVGNRKSCFPHFKLPSPCILQRSARRLFMEHRAQAPRRSFPLRRFMRSTRVNVVRQRSTFNLHRHRTREALGISCTRFLPAPTQSGALTRLHTSPLRTELAHSRGPNCLHLTGIM